MTMDPIKLKKSDKYTVKMCFQCGKHERRGKWIETKSTDDAVYEMIELRFKEAKKVELYIPEHKHNPGVNVEAEALIDKEQIVPIKIEYTVCKYCGKLKGQAFNGILQLRNPTEEITAFVEAALDKATSKGVFCTAKNDVRNGIDYKLTDSRFVRKVGKLLQNSFGGEIKETTRLITRDNQTGKELHRVTVLFKVPSFKKGDIVKYKGGQVRILNMGKKVFVEDMKTKRKHQLSYDKIQT